MNTDLSKTRARLFIQRMAALLKLNEMRSLLKMWTSLIREGFLIKGQMKLIDEWRKRGGSKSAEMVFNFNGSGKRKRFFV